MKQILILLLSLVLFISAASLENVAKEFSAECAKLSTDKPVRIGILPFTPNQDTYKESNPFGEFMAEQLENAMVTHGEKLRLFERKKLTDVAQELALNQSELIDAEQAIELGGVVPVDFIVNGTYTKTGSKVSVSFRVLDVVTGEIVHAAGKEVTLTKGMEELFVTNQTEVKESNDTQNIVITIDTAQKGPVLPACEVEQWPSLKVALRDLSTEEKIGTVVDIAMNIPFDTSCEHLHRAVLNQFHRYEIYNSEYAQYLYSEIPAVSDPDAMDELYNAQRYLLQGSLGSAHEWGIWKNISVGRRYPQSTLRKVITPDTLREDQVKLINSRVKEITALVEKKKLGRPIALTMDKGFYLLADILRTDYVEDGKGEEHLRAKNQILVSFCNSMKPEMWAKDLSVREARTYYNLLLKALYRSVLTGGEQREFFEERTKNLVNAATLNKDGSRLVIELLWTLYDQQFNANLTKEQQAMYGELFTSVMGASKEPFVQASMKVMLPYVKGWASIMALNYGVESDSLPSIQDLAILLSGNSNERQLVNAAYLLSKAGDKAKPAQNRVLRIYRRIPRLQLERPVALKKDLITILGNCTPEDSAAVVLLLGSMNESKTFRDTTMNDSERKKRVAELKELRGFALEAFAKGNAKTVSVLESVFNEGNLAQKKDAITALGMISSQKKKVMQILDNWYNQVQEVELQDAIDDALDRIEFQ